MDDRLNGFAVAETQLNYNTAMRIDHIRLSNYRFFHGDFELNFAGKNVLIYGENGSGKSSIFKALELLTKKEMPSDEFIKNRNVFSPDDDAAVEFGFSNKQNYIIDADTERHPDYVDFLHGLSVFVPTLDYKKLLKVHYSITEVEQMNLYNLFRILLRDYEYVNNEKLSSIKNPNQYFSELTKIMNDKIIDDINRYLDCYFESDCAIVAFNCRTEIDDEDENRIIPIINLTINYKENEIDRYHSFLNEARLSALAISIYLSTIKSLYGALNNDSLKILVLDDLLISLDMNNRMKLLNLLKGEFSDFQIIFFTHDKALFELYKNQIDWQKFELYLDDVADIPSVIVKKSTNDIEMAKGFYGKKEFNACGLHLRKALEKILKQYLPQEQQIDRNYRALDLAGLIDRAKSRSKDNQDVLLLLEQLTIARSHILNPLSHDDDRTIYQTELRDSIKTIETLKDLLNNK
jgi:DNA repair exonuclease SbcCD ATPase subunit